MTLSPEQIRAATALLSMTQKSLSEATGITRANLNKFDKGQCKFRIDTMERITSYFDNNGIVFTDNNGAEFKPKEDIIELYGHHGFVSFMDDVFEVAKAQGGEICVSNVNERHWIKWMHKDLYEAHAARMKPIENLSFKIFIEEGDDFFIADKFAEYKHIPTEFFNDQSFYVYGDRLALIAFEDKDVRINIIHSLGWAESFRHLFNFAWHHAPSIAGGEI